MTDKLDDIFRRQTEYMELLKDHDILPEFPVDLTSKPGQRILKETVFNVCEELFEASYTLKNRMHRLTDARLIDMDHYREELGDALAYFVELCVLSGFGPKELFEEYCRKNMIVRERLEKGY